METDADRGLSKKSLCIQSVGRTGGMSYYNDRWQVLSEYNGSNSPQRWFAYGNYIDEVLMMNTTTAAILAKVYVHDHLFSPVALVQMYHLDLKERYEYDAYGNCYVLEPNFAPDPDNKTDYGNPYYFTGRQLDFLDGGDLKIQYNRNRYYDYYTGRWLTHDPFATGSAEGPPNPRGLLAGYFDMMNLYQYARSGPVNSSDPLGLWGWPVHCFRTARWAEEVGLCFADEIGEWDISKDGGLMNPPRAFVIATVADIVAAVFELNTTPITTAYLMEVAYWHFPGADVFRPVAPGGWPAQREVKRWLKPRCNLEKFSAGLHQLQDSYSHQSNGRPVPWLGRGFVGHSRDRYGWNTERWDDPVATGLPSRLIDVLNSGWFPGGRTLLRQYRMLRVVLNSDADHPSASAAIRGSYDETELDTKYWMGEFRKQCPCILDGAHAGQSSCCIYHKGKSK